MPPVGATTTTACGATHGTTVGAHTTPTMVVRVCGVERDAAGNWHCCAQVYGNTVVAGYLTTMDKKSLKKRCADKLADLPRSETNRLRHRIGA